MIFKMQEPPLNPYGKHIIMKWVYYEGNMQISFTPQTWIRLSDTIVNRFFYQTPDIEYSSVRPPGFSRLWGVRIMIFDHFRNSRQPLPILRILGIVVIVRVFWPFWDCCDCESVLATKKEFLFEEQK